MKISHFAVKHPAIIAMILIVLVAFGGLSVAMTNIEFMCDISMPSVIVIAVYPGAGAEDVEQDVASILESQFVTLPNFKSIDSTSSNSVCMLTITFQDGIDPYEQLTEIRNRINQSMDELPEGLSGTPTALVGGASMLPIISFSAEGGNDTAKVTEYIEKTLKPKITSIKGVSDVSTTGGKELRASVKLRLQDLVAKGISVTQVYQILNYANTKIPAGSAEYKTNTVDVSFSGAFKSIKDIKEIPVGTGDGSVVIRLQDVADVELTYPDPEYYVTDGVKPIIIVSVEKRLDGNTMSIAKKVRKILENTEKETNGAITFDIINDDSRTVGASLKTVIKSGISGVLMAILVLFLFLNDWRATVIIGVSIPLSILFTFIGMKIAGITINLMSLSGLVVALGMIVDGSIVMLEQVYRYYSKRDENGLLKYSLQDSIFIGSNEVGSSILASTVTTVVVFIPIASLTGIVGMILKDVSITLILSLTASFLVAVIVVPFLLSLILSKDGPKKKKKSLFNKCIDKFEVFYRNILNWCMTSWKYVIFLSIGILFLTFCIISALEIAFIPSTDNSDFYISIELPVGTPLKETRVKMEKSYNLLKESVPEIKNTALYAGVSQSTILGSASAKSGYMHVVLVPVAERKRNIHEIILQTQDILSASIPDAQVKVSNGGFDRLLGYVSGGGGYGLTLISEDMDLLYETAEKIRSKLADDPDVVTTNLDTDFDTTTMVVDMSHEYMSSLGITSYEAGITTAILFNGLDAGRFRNLEDDTRYKIYLYSDITGKNVSIDDMANIRVVSLSGTPVSFANISNIKVEKSISRINHTDRQKTITISSTLLGEDTSGVNSRMKAYLEENPLPQGVTSSEGGIMELLSESIPPILRALIIAIFLVYTVMVLQFERFRQPMLIMVTIPFCIIGVVIGLLAFGSTLSLLSFLGIVSLAGVVVNNGIILIDYINLLRSEHVDVETIESLREDTVNGSASRIRPIFMTTLTTMLGVVPMAIAKGEGSEIYAPLGQAITGGLITSTIITLFIVPVLYYISERSKIIKQQRKDELKKESNK